MGIEIYLAAFAIVLAIPIAAVGIAGPDRIGSATSANRLRPSGPVSMRDMRLQQRTSDRLLAPVVNGVASKMRRFTPTGAIVEMERRINVAGMASTWTVERMLATKLGFAFVGTLVALWLLLSNFSLRQIILSGLIAAGSYLLPDMSLDRRAKDRAKLIERELPDVLDQMTIGVEAGLGFDAALARVARENEGPLAEEFGRMMQDRQLGMSRQEAFERVTTRSESGDLKHFVLALTQADKHGMPLATVLRVQAEEMRQKRRVRAEEKALSLPIKLVLPLVLCILPALFTVIIGPAAFRLMAGGLA
jgi:tight adherence protein C